MMIKKDEETVQLVDEIGELKEILREVSRKLTRIETKVKRGVTSASSKTSDFQNSPATADLSAENILQVYEELRLKS